MADLTPTPDSPGLHVSKPSPYTPATGSYTCRCGDTASATGDDQVRALADTYTTQHGPAHTRTGA
ncbi:hypothetical protein SLNWT_3631 [Streptomyces albus]|uniref:Mobile element transfer n=1 Tax=Streptomyces albus (strain ATCC 21838 / DSM 41398 / FERM P-419 / JCM 4703 / NBRC 107858) TaxID=1081613 RepID=A0A0B5F113_STRA4|nr:hypothetical protein SLNWT_3631 [Streptomyces albus]AOU78311.1 hypothetical protein SLNHY_3620 [Streptomyces albus]AYN34062.1 hypothetical protein DUI70_3561 [Streptomyces albus]